jgi:type I restriction enzyme S subunit
LKNDISRRSIPPRPVGSNSAKRSKGIVQGFWRLYTDDFYNIRIPFPPLAEQRQIMAQLDIELSAINTTFARLERELALLREYRTRLVADVVTGKLDVREAAAKLGGESEFDQPIETEEPAPGELEEALMGEAEES